MSQTNPWELYDQLIAGVPEGITVTDYCLGTNWSYMTAVRDDQVFCGVAYTASGGAKRTIKANMRGWDLRDVAQLAKSWCFEEASLGVAALNAWYNRSELLTPLGMEYDEPVELPDGSFKKLDAFDSFAPEIAAKDDARVTVVGHFPRIERVGEYSQLTVLERSCRDALDTPDPACEYVLPSTDYAFITGVTFINKTATRLLELCRNAGAKTILVGPSVVMSEKVFEWGATSLSGSIVKDPEEVAFCCKNGAGKLFGKGLVTVSVNMPK